MCFVRSTRRLIKTIYEHQYDSAESPEQLPWHFTEPPAMLDRVLRQRKTKGRALDIGCGTGVFSIYLAKLGYEVTGLDIVDKALDITRQSAREAGVEVEVVKADLMTWSPRARYDLVIDFGCLHSFGNPGERRAYRNQLLSWLGDQGDYVLRHWAPRHLLDWRHLGPRRIGRGRILRLFSPQLQEAAYEDEIIDMPMPWGPKVKIGLYWLRRAAKHAR